MAAQISAPALRNSKPPRLMGLITGVGNGKRGPEIVMRGQNVGLNKFILTKTYRRNFVFLRSSKRFKRGFVHLARGKE